MRVSLGLRVKTGSLTPSALAKVVDCVVDGLLIVGAWDVAFEEEEALESGKVEGGDLQRGPDAGQSGPRFAGGHVGLLMAQSCPVKSDVEIAMRERSLGSAVRGVKREWREAMGDVVYIWRWR